MKKKSFWKFFSNSSWKTYIILWLKMWFSCHPIYSTQFETMMCDCYVCESQECVHFKKFHILFIFKTSLKCHHLSNSLFKRFFNFRLCHKNLHNHHFGELCEKLLILPTLLRSSFHLLFCILLKVVNQKNSQHSVSRSLLVMTLMRISVKIWLFSFSTLRKVQFPFKIE